MGLRTSIRRKTSSARRLCRCSKHSTTGCVRSSRPLYPTLSSEQKQRLAALTIFALHQIGSALEQRMQSDDDDEWLVIMRQLKSSKKEKSQCRGCDFFVQAMSALPPIATAKAKFCKRSCLLHP